MQDDPYVTLSHRWGYPEPPKLSAVPDCGKGRISIEDLKLGISISILPHTFRDALNIVSHCGLRYLWIDSLCILQDKDANGQNPDWEREAAKVGDIYARAIFNIAALIDSNSDSGLFPKQQQILVPIFRDFTTRQGSRILSKLRNNVESTSTILYHSYRNDLEEAILDSPLLSRGWVFQEVLLTPANLFCTSEQMWWSCSHASLSQTFPKGCPEDCPEGRPRLWTVKGTEMVADDLRAEKEAIMVPDDCTDPISAWMQVLNHYTGTSVTFENDRLAAISGIANTFRALFPAMFRDASYHSGVWSTELVRQLSWCRSSGTHFPVSRFTTDHYHMPSWSPASCSVSTWQSSQLNREQDMLPIEAVTLDTSELDSFGRATDAKHSVLHLRGVPVQMSLDPESEKHFFWEAWPTGHPDVKVDVEWDNLEEIKVARATAASHWAYQALALYFHPYNDRYRVSGLLLRALGDSGDSTKDACNRWVRCGWFCWDYWEKAYLLDRIFEAFQFRRYSFIWEEEERSDSSSLRQKCVPTCEPTNLEDIYIV